jgi:hypothetical protein
MGFGSQLGSSAPKAHADTTDVAVVGCEFIAGAVDGVTTDTTSPADVGAACGNLPLPPTAAADTASVENLALAIGDEDGVLEKSDFADIEGFDHNEISTDCEGTISLFCTLDVFVFVDDEGPVTIDPDAGLVTIQSPGTSDFTCNADGATLTTDNDCAETVPPNGDGVVLFHLMEDTAAAGATVGVTVSQEAVGQDFDVNVVGSANEIKLTLVESTIGTSGSTANRVACVGDANDSTTPGDLGIPGVDVASADAVANANSTIAYAQAFDQDDNILARIPILFGIDPTSANNSIVSLAVGNVKEGVTGNTVVTLDPGNDIPIAAYVVLCGGNGTGEATITSDFDTEYAASVGSPVTPVEDHSEQDITVVGAPSAAALTASASQIKCDGTETSTVTAKVTDADGNNVADGTPVTFSVVALGTANPINTTTKDGVATSVITPLSNSSAGVTVIVTAGDADVAGQVQTSILIGCTLPLVTQPTLAPAVPPTATPRSGIGGPDTGNGGYLAQDGSGFPMWTLIVLALGSVTLVAGGAVARRVGK